MTHSESVARIAVALSKAQGTIEGAAKASLNPHFGSRYADLESVWTACRSALAVNEIAVVQSPSTVGSLVGMTTLLLHGSGEWIESDPLQVEARDAAPQAVGSCLTYLRRYQLASMAGVAPTDDDDAEAGQGRGEQQSVASKQHIVAPEPDGYADWLDRLHVLAAEGTARLDRAWQDSTPGHKNHLLRTAPETWREFKLIAARRIA